jgi:hypothetical protein
MKSVGILLYIRILLLVMRPNQVLAIVVVWNYQPGIGWGETDLRSADPPFSLPSKVYGRVLVGLIAYVAVAQGLRKLAKLVPSLIDDGSPAFGEEPRLSNDHPKGLVLEVARAFAKVDV